MRLPGEWKKLDVSRGKVANFLKKNFSKAKGNSNRVKKREEKNDSDPDAESARSFVKGERERGLDEMTKKIEKKNREAHFDNGCTPQTSPVQAHQNV